MRPPLNSNLAKNAGGGSLNSLNNSLNDLNLNQILSSNANKQLKVSLVESEGFYLIGNANSGLPTQTYLLTITIAFARNLIRLFTDDAAYATTGRNFYFVYTLLNNQVSTKPFSDIIACQINGERSTIRLHASLNNLKTFFQQQYSLEVIFTEINCDL
jgi:centrosomal protein CEP120